MVIDRVAQRRSRHGVVSPERRESFAGSQRSGGAPERVDVREHDLMDVGVGMPAVHEALAPIAQGELPVGDGPTFEVERGQQAQAIIERSAVGHDGRLDQPHFTQRATMRYRIDPGVHRDRIRPELDPGGSLPQALAGKQDRGNDW